MRNAAKLGAMISPSIASRAERLVYRIAGLPVAFSASLLGSSATEGADPLQTAFAWRYWHPDGAGEWSELIGGLIAWPLALVIASFWFTVRNGRIIRRRDGTGITRQLVDQLRLYFSAGVLAPWYYVFSLHDEPERAGSYLQRFETKPCLFLLLKQKRGSPLNDKSRFAAYCAERQIRCVQNVLYLNGDGGLSGVTLPDHDLFVKRSKGRGGKGAERWDRVGPDTFEGPNCERLGGDALLQRLVERSRRSPLIVQPRLTPHSDLSSLTTGALPTTRVVTCIDEHGNPEVVAAMFRSSIGSNRTVDNMHAGGMGCLVDVDTGKLSRASNLGADARIGWFSAHPDTGAQIESRALPLWDEAKELALAAHRHFDDRVVIGWDIAILEDGPIIVEGNGNPDLDILQRFMRIGFRRHRLGELMGHHLKNRLPAAA